MYCLFIGRDKSGVSRMFAYFFHMVAETLRSAEHAFNETGGPGFLLRETLRTV